MPTLVSPTGPVSGTAVPPGSKSYTNRALLLAALAEGTSTLEGALFSDDTRRMAEALRALGVQVEADETARRFTVAGVAGCFPLPNARVFIGNAGTAARFLTAAMCLGRGVFELDGDEAMRTRPIQPLLDALAQLGGDARSLLGNGCPPIRVTASGLVGGQARVLGSISSQYISALLIVGPYTRDGLTVEIEGKLVSRPYLAMTAQAMRRFGVDLVEDSPSRYHVAPSSGYVATTYPVEPDASAASYFFGAAAITGGRIRVEHLGRSSLQGDLGFVHILERMGCTVRQTEDATEVLGPPPGRLAGVEVDMADLSDTAQTLATVAVFASGPTRVTGIGFIRRKETNRIAAVVSELRRLGISASEEADGFLIHPGDPRPGRVETYDDHRMAMSFSLLGLRVRGIEIANPMCVSKTFPGYWDALAQLVGR